jgi:F-type H+-transporting ATPase subunit beta
MTNNVGKVISVRGVVVELAFAVAPKIYDAVKLASKNSAGEDVYVEVLQQLEDGVVRGIAMASTDGIKRGDAAESTGAPISVPVGPEVLGRVFNVLGDPIDNLPAPKAKEKWAIHRAAPGFLDLSNKAEVFETGIKVIDLIAPMLK